MKLKQISRKTIALVLSALMVFSTLLVGTITTANAETPVNNTSVFYFDNSKTNWSDSSIQLVVGKDSYSSVYGMSKITNTNIYRYQMTVDWKDATYIAVIGDSSAWGSANWGPSNLTNANHYTAAYTGPYTFDGSSSYILTPANGDNGTSLSVAHLSSTYNSLNTTQTLKAQVSDDGSTYSDATSAVATLSISSYKMTGTATASSSSASQSAVSVNTSAARTATTELSYSGLSSSYTFVGWYNSSGTQLSTSSTYSYTTGSSAATYIARFKKAATQLTKPTIAWASGDDGAIPPSGSQTLKVTNTSAYSGISGITYKLSNGTTSSTGEFTVTSAGTYTVTVSSTDTKYTTSAASNSLTATAITAKYGLTGDFGSSWSSTIVSGWAIDTYASDVTESKYVFKKEITASSDNMYFRLCDGTSQYKPEGASSGNDYDVTNCSSYSTAKATVVGDAGAFKIPKAGKYTVYVDQSGTTPKVWVVNNTVKHNVTFTPSPTGGKVTVNDSSTTPVSVAEGDNYTVKLTPNTGYEVNTFTVGGVDKKSSLLNNTYTGTMGTSDVAIAATFKKTTYSVSINQQTGGTVSVDKTTANYQDTVTITATPAAGYELSSFSVTDASSQTVTVTTSGNTGTFSMPASNVTVRANFGKKNYTITKFGTPDGGGSAASVKINSQEASHYELGDVLTITGTPNAGYKLKSITYQVGSGSTQTLSGNTLTITEDYIGNLSFFANYEALPTYAITTNYDSSMGSLGVDKSSTYEGDTVTITTSPNSGYKLVSVSAKGAADGTVLQVSGNEFTMPAQAVTVTATFEAYQNHNVTVASGITGGTVSVSPTSAKFGDTVTITHSPEEGYVCKSVSAETTDGKSLDLTNSTFTMPDQDVIVSATFEVTQTRNFYVTGRFPVKNESGTIEWNDLSSSSDWNTQSTKFPFTRVGNSSTYKLETNLTIKEISELKYNKQSTYFRFFENTGGVSSEYAVSTNTDLKASNAGTKYQTVKSESSNFLFNDTASTSTEPVVLYLDASTDAPKFYFMLEAPVAKFTVNMEQGVSSRGSSYLDGNTSLTTVKHTYDDPAVLFTTSATTGYKVFGYQIKMTLNDGKTVLASTTDISMLPGNKYQASYTFPDNVMSATVTPVFASSTAELTTVYLKMKPGDNDLNNVYEPCYYTWVTDSEGKTTKTPEGNWPGQKLLYIGNDTYMAMAETAVSGIVFNNPADDGKYQTYDYDEFVKLNKLGYKQVTFELKKGTKTGLNKTIADNQAPATCQDTAYSTPAITKDSMNETVRDGQFELDTNIEGYYIDVFGDRLVGTDGRFIHQDDITGATTTLKLNQILDKLGKKSGAELYGARYGWYSEDSEAKGNRNASYDMEYCIRTYFMDFDETNINVAQLVSGYGQIEGGHGPLSGSNQTNAQYMNSQGNAMKYYIGTNTTKTFSTGNEVLETKYRGVPYLVSYMARTDTRATEYDKEQTDGHNRVDGKWYYQAEKPQLTVKAKAGLMKEDGTIVMTDGKITEQPDTIGTGYVNGASEAVVPQGDTCTLSGTPANGYKLVGFYSETGELLPSSTPVVGSSATYFAVFQALPAGTVTLTNTIYRFDNPTHSGGSGSLGVKLIVTPYITSSGTYGDPVTYTGSSSVTAPISDNDKLRWVITGKASGADEFIAFRQPEQQADGTVYYAALDDPDCLSADSSSATYTSYEIIWNWAKQDTSGNKKLVINEYTDFRKVSVMATLEYKYKNRFDEWRTYTVKNVELSPEEIENNYTPSSTTIAAHAPAIDEVFQSCTWNVSQAGKLETGKSYALLTAEQDLKKFWYMIDNGDGDVKGHMVEYNTLITLDAPDRNSSDKKFAYWQQYMCDENGDKTGDPEIFSFEKYEQVRVTFNRYFEAVYSDEANPTFITTLQDAVYTREKYTDESGNTKDYIYTDFLMQFETSVKGLEMKDFVNGTGDAQKIATNVKFGIILERDMNYSGYSGSGNITAPTTDTDILKNTVTDYAKNLTAGGTANGWSSTSDTSKPQYNYYYHFFDYTDRANQLTDKGRIDGYFKYENTAENRAKVYNAYTYIIYHDVFANTDVVILSSPKVMSMYDIGIKDDGKSAY